MTTSHGALATSNRNATTRGQNPPGFLWHLPIPGVKRSEQEPDYDRIDPGERRTHARTPDRHALPHITPSKHDRPRQPLLPA